ncbi:MAG: hypothetical protein ACM31C_17760, partial [Acidobacteriota bacterium]
AGAEEAVQRRQSRVASVSFVGVAAFLALLAWDGLRDVSLFALVAALTLVMAVAALLLARRHATVGEMMAVVAGNALLAALLSRAFGPLIVVPSLICVMAVSLTSYPQLIDRARVIIGVLAAAWLVPVVLEWLHVIAPTWGVEGGRVVSMSTMIVIRGASTSTLLVATNLIAIFAIALFANALARSRRDAQRQLVIQAWHLRQLLPEAAA